MNDENEKLKVKLFRLKIITMIIAIIFIIVQINQMFSHREYLGYDIQEVLQAMYSLKTDMEYVKIKEAPYTVFGEQLSKISNVRNRIDRNLNFIERRMLRSNSEFLHINYEFNHFVEILKKRYETGNWSAKDEKIYNMMKEYLSELSTLTNEESQTFFELNEIGFLKPLFLPIEIKSINDCCHKINQLSILYKAYNKLPDEMEPISQDKLSEKIKSILNQKGTTIKFPEWKDQSLKFGINYEFQVFDDQKKEIQMGKIDAYTGQIFSFEYPYFNVSEKVELLSLDVTKEALGKLLDRLYGEKLDFQIKYLGINKEFSSDEDIKMYSFEVRPIFKGYKLDYLIRIDLDARNNKLSMMRVQKGHYSQIEKVNDSLLNIDDTKLINSANALKGLKINGVDKYHFSETLIIHSMLSGNYVLAHTYKNESESIYINAMSGKQEYIY